MLEAKAKVVARFNRTIKQAPPLYALFRWARTEKVLLGWALKGRPLPPPPEYKQRVVAEYARRFALRILIETGSYMGDMVEACRTKFDHIVSIELDPYLYEQAKARFAQFKHIQIYEGDSAQVLPLLLTNMVCPCLFWLDAHYSGGITASGMVETPIEQELRTIMAHPVLGHVILIDDAHCFTGIGGYPDYVALQGLVLHQRPDWMLEMKDDIIRIHPSPMKVARGLERLIHR